MPELICLNAKWSVSYTHLDVYKRQGLRTAVENGNRDDIVITMDADNSHNPAQIPLMIKKINEGYDIVIASRYRKGSKIVGLSNFRKLTSFLAGSLFVVFAPIDGVRDYTCAVSYTHLDVYKRQVLVSCIGIST